MADVLVVFPNRGLFTAFENQQRVLRGIPFKGRNKATGELRPDKQGTIAYTEALDNLTPGNNTVITWVSDDVDVSGLNVVTLAEAKAQGWFSEDDLV